MMPRRTHQMLEKIKNLREQNFEGEPEANNWIKRILNKAT